ncbi:hypothetical protein [Wukongibacter sp. M2B1]
MENKFLYISAGIYILLGVLVLFDAFNPPDFLIAFLYFLCAAIFIKN